VSLLRDNSLTQQKRSNSYGDALNLMGEADGPVLGFDRSVPLEAAVESRNCWLEVSMRAI
jgi:hypothetical protein